MLDIFKRQTYERWIETLRNDQARDRIQMRIMRLAVGNPVVLLCAGDKSSQPDDIVNAYRIAEDWRHSHGTQERIVFPL